MTSTPFAFTINHDRDSPASNDPNFFASGMSSRVQNRLFQITDSSMWREGRMIILTEGFERCFRP